MSEHLPHEINIQKILKLQIFNARSVKNCFVFGLAHPFSLLHQSFLQNLKKLDYIWFGQCPLEQTIFQKGAYVLLRPQKKVILMWIPSFLVSKNPTCIFYHCRSLKVLRMCCCVCRKPFLLFWFLCFFAWRPEQIQKLVCCLFVCLFVCLNRWSSFPPQINLNHFARRQNRISQRTKQVFQGTLQHGQTFFFSFLRNQI